MKKILLIALMIILAVLPVSAAENKLYFTEYDHKLYYDSSLISENLFMKHIEMVPGEVYTDELIIENGSHTSYILYFQVKPVNQSVLADELLNHINMKIYLDGTVIYDGKAKGLDYTNSGVNLQDAIKLREFDGKEKSLLKVETSLADGYSNSENAEYSYIDWVFYAQYGDEGSSTEDNNGSTIDDNSTNPPKDLSDPIEIIRVPNTLKNAFPIVTIISSILCIIGVIIILYEQRKRKE